MNLRRRVSLFFIVFGITIAVSFGLGGYLLFKRNRPTKVSKEEVSQASSQDQDLQALLRSADTYLKNKETEQALIAYRKALSLNPASLEGQLGLARGELLAGREEIAGQEYERALSLESKNTIALLQLARIYSHQPKTWNQAEIKFKEYLKLQSGEPEAQLGLARVLAWQGKSEEAAEIFSRDDVAKRMTQQDHRDYVFALIKSGQSDRAEPLLKKLIVSRPHDFELKLQLASLYASRKDWNAALPIYKSLLQERPNDLRLNLTYGLGLLAVKNYQPALAPLQKASMGMPSNGEAGLGYARALKGTANLKKAAKEFERVLPQYHNNPATTREYADLLLEKRDYRKSEKYYKEAHGLGLRDDRLLTGLAGALAGNGKPKEALPYLEEVYKRNPTDRLALELAKVYQRLGRRDRALELLATIEKSSQRVAK